MRINVIMENKIINKKGKIIAIEPSKKTLKVLNYLENLQIILVEKM